MIRESVYFKKTEAQLLKLGFELEREGWPCNYYRHKESIFYTIDLYREDSDIILTLEESTNYFIEIVVIKRREFAAFKKFWPILARNRK